MSTSPPALLRASEAAHYLSLSRSKLYALIQTGELEAVHVGRCMRLRRNTLDEFIDQLGE